jgi:hypothetical protein
MHFAGQFRFAAAGTRRYFGPQNGATLRGNGQASVTFAASRKRFIHQMTRQTALTDHLPR